MIPDECEVKKTAEPTPHGTPIWEATMYKRAGRLFNEGSGISWKEENLEPEDRELGRICPSINELAEAGVRPAASREFIKRVTAVLKEYISHNTHTCGRISVRLNNDEIANNTGPR